MWIRSPERSTASHLVYRDRCQAQVWHRRGWSLRKRRYDAVVEGAMHLCYADHPSDEVLADPVQEYLGKDLPSQVMRRFWVARKIGLGYHFSSLPGDVQGQRLCRMWGKSNDGCHRQASHVF